MHTEEVNTNISFVTYKCELRAIHIYCLEQCLSKSSDVYIGTQNWVMGLIVCLRCSLGSIQLHWLHSKEWVSALSRCRWLKPSLHALADRRSHVAALFSGGDFQHDGRRNYSKATENVVTMLNVTYRLTSSAFSTSPIYKCAIQAPPIARTVGLFWSNNDERKCSETRQIKRMKDYINKHVQTSTQILPTSSLRNIQPRVTRICRLIFRSAWTLWDVTK